MNTNKLIKKLSRETIQLPPNKVEKSKKKYSRKQKKKIKIEETKNVIYRI